MEIFSDGRAFELDEMRWVKEIEFTTTDESFTLKKGTFVECKGHKWRITDCQRNADGSRTVTASKAD
jgi:hypothetical protein